MLSLLSRRTVPYQLPSGTNPLAMTGFSLSGTPQLLRSRAMDHLLRSRAMKKNLENSRENQAFRVVELLKSSGVGQWTTSSGAGQWRKASKASLFHSRTPQLQLRSRALDHLLRSRAMETKHENPGKKQAFCLSELPNVSSEVGPWPTFSEVGPWRKHANPREKAFRVVEILNS